MRLSRYCLPDFKETPAEAQIASHLHTGMIKQASAGIRALGPTRICPENSN